MLWLGGRKDGLAGRTAEICLYCVWSRLLDRVTADPGVCHKARNSPQLQILFINSSHLIQPTSHIAFNT
jgi:hypothetical protein